MHSDESQNKAQCLRSLGENKTGYCAENRIFPTNVSLKKSPHLLALLFHTLWIMYCYAKQC